MRIALVGAGAFGEKHLEALAAIEDANVVSVVSQNAEQAAAIAAKYGVQHSGTKLGAVLTRPDIDAVILATPTQLHAKQAMACMDAGKHVQIEIPLADTLADAEAIVAKQRETGLICMGGHTRRFNPSHQWIKNRIDAGVLAIQSMNVQTFFLRRENRNAKGESRSWTDHLLWHHAAHTVDLFQYMTGSQIAAAHAMQGPRHPELGIAMDLSIQMKSATGQLCTLALSFNNEGPIGSFFRYICDRGTYIARYDELFTADEVPVDLGRGGELADGIMRQDREFLRAIREGREPNAAVGQLIDCYRVIAALADDLERQDGWA